MATRIVISAVGVLVMSLSLSVFGSVEQYEPGTSSAVISRSPMKSEQDFPVRGEIRQTYQLSPNANVEVRGIEGSVEVETTDGSTAEIHFVRYGRTQADYDCETIVVQHSPTTLVVHHQTNTGNQCRAIHAREEMKLIVPRSANLNLNDIEGDLTVGNTAGFLRLNNIEGSVQAGEVQAAEIASIEKDVLLNVAQLTSQGITIRNIEGVVELGVTENLNANLRVGRVSANVEINLPNVKTSEFGRGNFQLQLGTGGADISILGIEGSVKIRRS